MSKLHRIALAALAAVALTSTARAADEDGAWNSKYGMIFTLQNVFTQPGILGDYGGGVGFQMNRDPQTAWRFRVDLSRASDSAAEVKTTAGGVTNTTTQAPTSGYTSQYGLGVTATYIKRLTPLALSPYAGVGGALGYNGTFLAYDDKTNGVLNRTIDNSTNGFGLGALGVLGLDWRVHKSVSIFAEYGVDLTLVSYASTDNKTTNGAGAVTETKYSRTKFFNFNTGLTQGAQLGILAYF